MANPEHLLQLYSGVPEWNKWRQENPRIVPDLSQTDFVNCNLTGVDFHDMNLAYLSFAGASLRSAKLDGSILVGAVLYGADLRSASLKRAWLRSANITKADFRWAKLQETNLEHAFVQDPEFLEPPTVTFVEADLSNARLVRSRLSGATFEEANLYAVDASGADLSAARFKNCELSASNFAEANLTGATIEQCDLSMCVLVKTDLTNAIVSNCHVYGVSVWRPILDGTAQSELRITPTDEPSVVVDNLEMAQFISLLLDNDRLRDAIDSLTAKAVLILGRFTQDRKAVLDAMRAELRIKGYVPIVFDFQPPTSRDLTETISTLAHLVRFVIADITDPRSVPQELQAIVPTLGSVPIAPVLEAGSTEYGMFESFRKYWWVLPVTTYANTDDLLILLPTIIDSAEERIKELQSQKR